MKILIVEDQENLAKVIKEVLRNEGINSDYILDGLAAQNLVETNQEEYDLIILDLMLPKKDGVAVCKTWRDKKITTPVLMMTAKDSIEDIIKGLNAGADDYLVKPFSFEVLIARIRAILRRPHSILPLELKTRHLTLDPIRRVILKNNKKEVKLTLKEFNMLEYLMRNPNQALTREQIMSNAWDFASESFSNVIDVHVTNIRKKIGDKNGKIIETIHGLGYRINS